MTEWATFLHRPAEVFFDFNMVRNEIEHRTTILAGSNKGITNQEIILKEYTLLYNLTLVDLPGFTKVLVEDQPIDINKQILTLIVSYAKQSNSIILAVVTASTDPSTSQSLQITKELDPDVSRTIAVVIKLDLIDKERQQDAVELLCSHKIPMKLGIVGVLIAVKKILMKTNRWMLL